MFLEILLRNEPAEGVACGFLLGFFFKENITDFVFVLLLNRHQS